MSPDSWLPIFLPIIGSGLVMGIVYLILANRKEKLDDARMAAIAAEHLISIDKSINNIDREINRIRDRLEELEKVAFRK